ncbi:MAG: transporter substrate-binding domain-containing protein [Rhodospirillaceae bacterium]|jgi:polar amino acid transport system substrate-binding protein|nr:transporter substrate-binding domain-containing protein [Rhodospirillaceae bacterium]
MKLVFKFFSLLVLVGCTLVLPSSVWASERLTLVTVENSPDTFAGEIILLKAYRKLNIELTIKRLPAARALKLASTGKVDGEIQRIDAIKKLFKNLVQIRPAINFLEVGVFTKSKNFQINGWESLRQNSLGIIRGIKFTEINTAGMNTVVVNGYKSAFKMLDKERFDLAVIPRLNGLFEQAKSKNTDIRELVPAVQRYELFHYLHKSKVHLVPKISSVIKSMKQNGELDSIKKQVVTILLRLAESRRSICKDDYSCFSNILK